MNTRTHTRRLPRPALLAVLLSTLLLISFSNVRQADASRAQTPAQQAAGASPSDTVREFYRAMREKRFREAFGMSIYKPAIEGLSAADFDELRPDFETLARNIPEKIEINGEQISGDTATVFIRVIDDKSGAGNTEPVTLLRDGQMWMVGDRANQEIVRKQGKQFFFEARIEAHHNEVQTELQQIAKAQFVYSTQHSGLYTDFATLARDGLVSAELVAGQSLGYQFQLMLGKDNKSYGVRAEPVRYARTGRLSFYMDSSGIASKDTGGKPLKANSVKP